jgi:hypothetical protein
MWRRLVLAAPLALAACVRPSAETRAPALEALIGADEAAVLRQYGAPDFSYTNGGVRTLIYDRRVVEHAGGPRPRAASFPCRISFTLAQGRVRSFDQQGAGC